MGRPRALHGARMFPGGPVRPRGCAALTGTNICFTLIVPGITCPRRRGRPTAVVPRRSPSCHRRSTMDFQFNHEQQLWHDTVHLFMEKDVGREYTREHDASREFPEEVFQKMAKLGWLGLLVDEEEDGSAADPIMFAIFCEAIGKFSLDMAACIMKSR